MANKSNVVGSNKWQKLLLVLDGLAAQYNPAIKKQKAFKVIREEFFNVCFNYAYPSLPPKGVGKTRSNLMRLKKSTSILLQSIAELDIREYLLISLEPGSSTLIDKIREDIGQLESIIQKVSGKLPLNDKRKTSKMQSYEFISGLMDIYHKITDRPLARSSKQILDLTRKSGVRHRPGGPLFRFIWQSAINLNANLKETQIEQAIRSLIAEKKAI